MRATPISTNFKQGGLEVDPDGQFLAGSFRVADKRTEIGSWRPRTRNSHQHGIGRCALLGKFSWVQQHPHDLPRIASRPSQTMRGTTTKAATGSVQAACQMALTPSPISAIRER